MKRLLIFVLLLAWSSYGLACDKQAKPPTVDDVVFDHITADTAELDQKLHDAYQCKYPIAMIFSSDGYEPMQLITGSQPATPTDETGQPITGDVLVGFVLNTDGSPVDPVILETDSDALSKIALAHVIGLRYRPAEFNSRIVRALSVQVYQFR